MIQTLEEYCSPIQYASSDTFGVKIGGYFTSQTVCYFFRHQLLGHFAEEFIRIKFIKIQAMIVEYIIAQFILTSCQKKRYEQGYHIIEELVSK